MRLPNLQACARRQHLPGVSSDVKICLAYCLCFANRAEILTASHPCSVDKTSLVMLSKLLPQCVTSDVVGQPRGRR